MKRFASKPVAVYLLCAAAILLPLLFAKGYIFATDMVFAPGIPWPQSITNSFPLFALLHILTFVLPVMLIQKILLVTVFVLGGLGAHLLLSELKPKVVTDEKIWRAAPYFAGLFYIFNPFVYSRFMTGQWLILLGYALLPWVLWSLLKILRKPGLSAALVLAGFTLALATASLHVLGICLVVVAIVIAAKAWDGRRDKARLRKTAKYCLLALAATAIASSYWLLPLVLGTGHTADTIDSFTAADTEAFQTVSGDYGAVVNVLALQGFWGDDANLYMLPQDEFGWWWLPILSLWALVGAGVVWAWKNQPRTARVIIAIGVMGFVLAVGNTCTGFSYMNNWLYGHIPFFDGYREPQKFTIFLVLAYAYFASIGTYCLGHILAKSPAKNYYWLAMAVPVLCAPLLLWGGAGQLKASEYPEGWYSAKQILSKDLSGNSRVLFLPWHLYMPYKFSSGTTANPAVKFFGPSIVSSQDPEIGDVHGRYADNISQVIADKVLPGAERDEGLSVHLQQLGIKYIILVKEFDYREYSYLDSKKGIDLLEDNIDLKIYAVGKEAAE